jgi:CubicO group peptidase (beta-lactamase class C family)
VRIRQSLAGLAVGLPILLVGPSVGPAVAQSLDERVDRFIHAEMQRRGIPGLGLAIVRHGRLDRVVGYGLASVEHGVPVSDSTPFQINSATKSFTAVLVLQQVERGRIRLDDPIGRHLDSLPPAWRDVTIRQLLSHTSGLPDVVENPMSGTLLARNVPDALALLSDKPMMFAPAASWSYNQTNYMLLGLLLEKLSGTPFATLCRDALFAPLGIRTASFGDARAVVPGRATGYTRLSTAGGQVRPLDHLEVTWYEFEPFLYTAAALNISARDFGRWVEALLAGRFVSRASLEEIWRPVEVAGKPVDLGHSLGFGLGWPLLVRAAHRAAGGSGGVRAAFFVYPDDDLAVIVLTNLMGAQPEALVEGVANAYLGHLEQR